MYCHEHSGITQMGGSEYREASTSARTLPPLGTLTRGLSLAQLHVVLTIWQIVSSWGFSGRHPDGCISVIAGSRLSQIRTHENGTRPRTPQVQC